MATDGTTTINHLVELFHKSRSKGESVNLSKNCTTTPILDTTTILDVTSILDTTTILDTTKKEEASLSVEKRPAKES